MSTAVFIGRFQPFHLGHQSVVVNSLYSNTTIDKLVILVGSTNKHRSVKNPFTFEQRRDMILHSLQDLASSHPLFCDILSKVVIEPISDYVYNDEKWATQVRSVCSAHKVNTIIGYNKDESSFYLKLFPEWNLVEVAPFSQPNSTEEILSANKIRSMMFEPRSSIAELSLLSVVPGAVYEFIQNFRQSKTYEILKDEYNLFKRERERFKDYPFPNSLNCCTADSVVVCSGHILLVTRKAAPGQGLLALPGGHKDSKETFYQCALRELTEETRLKVPEKVLKGSMVDKEVFDHPARSQNLTKPTVAFYFLIQPDFDGKLPKVKGGDDALEAKWYSLDYVKENQNMLFDDHYDIIEYFTGI